MDIANSVLAGVGQHRDILERLGENEPSTKLEAQAIIEGIRADKGYLDEDTMQDLENVRARSRETIMRVIEQKREMEASYTKSVSEQLYSSKYRFLYELIQNADDLLFTVAKANKKLPTLCFSVTPQRLTVETNENGFTRKNIEAICATGKSSKKATATDDHIGEKGFGFKSVFAVADEVKIQSGLWSFRFIHRRGEGGLGMLTPLDAPTETLTSWVTTKTTLNFTEATRAEYARLVDAILNMPTTTIFFLRKIKLIQFHIIHPDGQEETIKIRKRTKIYDSVSMTRTRELNGVVEQEESNYYKVTHTVSHMPEDDRRKDIHSVTIVLAFPIDPITERPKLSELGQYAFAYLPLQRLPQIQFLIHSDFITSASRESVIDCAWNEKICDGVAHAFTKAVRSFATRTHSLRYSWLDFLPTKTMEHPWNTLYPKINALLQKLPILETRGGQFKVPSQFRLLPDVFLYQDEPILPDLDEEIYLNAAYEAWIPGTMRDLGVRVMNWEEILARIQADTASLTSRIRTRSSDDHWHEAFATLGSHAFSADLGMKESQQRRFKQLAIIPLSRPNQWTGAPRMGFGGLNNIYFRCTGTTNIPEDIGLALMGNSASSNSTRRKFYTTLGVEECPKATVFAKIDQAHQSAGVPLNYESHLTYLFYIPGYSESQKLRLRFPTDDGRSILNTARFYLPSDNQFHTEQLLPLAIRKQLKINILPRSLVELKRKPVHAFALPSGGQTWKNWLTELTEARYYPSLLSSAEESLELRSTYPGLLSPILQAVLRHRPRKFLGTLKAHWNAYQKDVSYVCDTLRDCRVPCRSGSRVPLLTTYLPTVEVLDGLRKLSVEDSEDGIFILDLPDGDLDDATYRQWRFLEEFGVRSKPDLNLYKLVLEEMVYADSASVALMTLLYVSMARLATIEDQAQLREFFDLTEFIRDPDADGGWVHVKDCVWKGPAFLRHTSVLEMKYSSEPILKDFFSKTLDIPNSTIYTVLNELKAWNENSNDTRGLSESREIYSHLSVHFGNNTDWDSLRNEFRNNELILGNHGVWHKLETCLWRIPFPLSGYQDLQVIYPDLEDFFTKKLKVRKVTPTMLLNEIKRMAEQAQPRIEDIKHRLIETGMMLTKHDIAAGVETALQNLREARFLPKRLTDGNLTLVGVTDDFAILDHARFGNALADKGVLLDFSIEETQILDVMFRHLGLTHRYLSTAITEETSAGAAVCMDHPLSRQLNDRAFALYCCAAKHKSRRALRNESLLFDQLRQCEVHTTDSITTHLVLHLTTVPLKVPSDRPSLHHEVIDGRLKIYVPEDENQRRASHRTKLPKLLASISGTDVAALHDISLILSSSLRDLDSMLSEQDISEVLWIEKPVLDLPEIEEIVPSIEEVHEPYAASESRSRHVSSAEIGWTARASSQRSRPSSVPVDVDLDGQSATAWRSGYRKLLGQLIKIARSGFDMSNNDIEPFDQELTFFSSFATFGDRAREEGAYNCRVGAAGEAYVFEYLSCLDLPDFTRESWQSTIRGAVAIHPRYEGIRDWRGHETADIVYTDRNGALTQYLRNVCEGSFPTQLADHDHVTHPIEYYLEVKTTTGECETRFYMSNIQYKRMEDMALCDGQRPTRVYVILRVFHLVTPNVRMKFFVDPWRLRGTHLDFEAEQWFGYTR
ncbi:hypothetical protein K491DRAFT_599984 [Lophiostoma macrostomum CBS 122681]|uniref:Protein NO VEIN C-terminal domain-containing protein n=1 Tax=Lophiostoma macrostomum CBS 122681 TaxID=1314788 RepID=A0A6A6T4L9_9PLEO|nr:hypothetical protein K491DRAFT_599984 [Lophiostoma macrostomum CBS 122681]